MINMVRHGLLIVILLILNSLRLILKRLLNFMEIKNIEIADCRVLSTSIIANKFIIKFESIYDVVIKQFIENVDLVIYDWSSFEAKLYIANALRESFVEVNLTTDKMEFFNFIQGIEVYEGNLLLQGFSRESGNWLEYRFKSGKFFFKRPADTSRPYH